MNKTVVIDIVGLSTSLLGEHTPFLTDYIARHHFTHIRPVLPALTTTAQTCYLTGQWPAQHGIVGNGWYDRTDAEIKFWKQSNHLVQAENIWERAKREDPTFTCSQMFWWYNMYADVDFSATPRPQYHADGLKLPDCYTHPAALREELTARLGTFPLFSFWGPKTTIDSSRWIARAAMHVEEQHNPTLTLIYLPHLDYGLQRYGVNFAKIAPDLREIDALVAEVVTFYQKRGAQVILLSEYGINPVSRPVYINRILREAGLIQVRVEAGRELLDAGASAAFATPDHQIAHIYVDDPAQIPAIKTLLSNVPGVAEVLDEAGKTAHHLNHERAGDLVAIADPDSWFAYYYWLDEAKKPDFAQAVDIHRKPGYDPAELFLDQTNPFISAKAAYKLARKLLGFRYLMDVISLDATLVKGSHGAINVGREFYPVLITDRPQPQPELEAIAVYDVLWQHLTEAKQAENP